jgi:hypothetical protein
VLVIPITFIFISVRRAMLYAMIWALPFALPYIVNDLAHVATPWQHHKATPKLGGSR